MVEQDLDPEQQLQSSSLINIVNPKLEMNLDHPGRPNLNTQVEGNLTHRQKWKRKNCEM